MAAAIRDTASASPMSSTGPGDSTRDFIAKVLCSSGISYALTNPLILDKSSVNSSTVTSSFFST